MPVFETVIGQC